MRSRRRVAWIVVGCTTLLLAATPPFLYFDGLRGVPKNREPLSDFAITESIAQSYWRFLEGEGRPSVSPKNPYGFVFETLAEINVPETGETRSAEYALLSEAAQTLMGREAFDGKSDWHLSNAAASIWISRHWTVHEAMATVLQSTNFGNGLQGIEAASRGYFGIPAANLNDVQMMYLLVISAAPSSYDPWCNPENHRVRFEAFSKRLGYSEEYGSVQAIQSQTVQCSAAN